MAWLECDALQPYLFFEPETRNSKPGGVCMKEFKIPQAVALVLLASALTAGDLMALPPSFQQAQTAASKPTLAEVQVRTMLLEFLKGVPSNDPDVFDTFFADDVIYTRGAGVVIHKSDIMKGLSKTPTTTAKHEPDVTYGAEDIVVRQYGDTAILAFELVQHTPGKPDVKYRNSGTFLKRNGKWQVVLWQATPEAASNEGK
jgi:ketosteroid isomerase-like protein